MRRRYRPAFSNLWTRYASVRRPMTHKGSSLKAMRLMRFGSNQLPDGSKKKILSVPRYDFNWQTYYMFKEPLQVPKGAKIVSTAWYDNSASNRANPDPTVDVKWGDQTWEEMQYTGILVSPASQTHSTVASGRQR